MSDQSGKDKTAVAAAWFAGVLALAAGGAGLLIAALAVGVERAWSRRGGGRDLRDAQRRDRYGDNLAWLAQDRARRDRYRQARQQWWTGGAQGDPPAAPKAASRLAAWLRRRWARAYVTVADFAAGFAAGWRAADEARRRGAKPGEVIRTRPDPDPDPPPPAEPKPTPQAETTQPAPADTEPVTPDPSQPAPATDGGQPDMTAPTTPPPASSAPQGDSNAAVMAAHLTNVEDRQKTISDLTDQLATERTALENEVTAANEFAEQTGQTAETRQALDASMAVVAQLGDQIGGVSDSAEAAAEQVSAARQGLRVVEEAEDALASAGADGRAVAPAGAAA